MTKPETTAIILAAVEAALKDQVEGMSTPFPKSMSSQQITSLAIEGRTSDPTNPVEGQIWLRTDL